VFGVATFCSPVGQNTPPIPPPRLSSPACANILLYRISDLSYKRNTLARDEGRIAIVTNRGLGSDGRDGVGREAHCRAGNREQGAFRAYDPAPTASSHGFGREHAPAFEATCEDVRGRPSRVVLTPGVCASSPAVMPRPTGTRIDHPQGDGGNSATLPEESTKYAVNHCAGKAGRSAHLWSTPCASFRARIAGASRRPAFPAPLSR
jgi:hypothetical protein